VVSALFKRPSKPTALPAGIPRQLDLIKPWRSESILEKFYASKAAVLKLKDKN
jgi:hypothetical protein